MKQMVIFLSILLLTWPGLDAQKQIKYYRMDSIKTIRGEIKEITWEKCYQKKDFTVMYVEEKKSGDIFRVEVSPAWFFNMDLAKGSRIEVAGSYSREKNRHTILTRSINYQGENFQFRDKNGFPLWQRKSKYRGRQQSRNKRKVGRSEQH